MYAQAHFSDIRTAIAREIEAAQISIIAAVAWLTDPALFEPLVNAARRGCKVQVALLDDYINRRSRLSFERLRAAGGHVFWIPKAEGSTGSLHHKFCVLDDEVVITGSYNWTRRASRADENVLVVRGDTMLVRGYRDTFERMLEKHNLVEAPTVLDTQQLMRRLEVVYNLILLGDCDTLATQLPRLDAARSVEAVAEVLELIRQEEWESASERLQCILARGMAVVLYQDPELQALRLELRTLEAQVVALSNEQAELERLIQQFAQRQNLALGDVLEGCLRLRREYWRRRAEQSGAAEDRAAQEEARAEHEDYHNSREVFEHLPEPPELALDQQSELKRLFREACMSCHPDRVTEVDQAAAEAVFVQIQQAYRQNDLETLRRLHQHLVEGKPFADPVTVVTEQAQLRRRITHLRLEVERRLAEILTLREGETYRTLNTIDDWDAYFAATRKRLEEECAQLRRRIEENDYVEG